MGELANGSLPPSFLPYTAYAMALAIPTPMAWVRVVGKCQIRAMAGRHFYYLCAFGGMMSYKTFSFLPLSPVFARRDICVLHIPDLDKYSRTKPGLHRTCAQCC